MNAPTGHSLFGMSVMERRIGCPGSAAAEQNLPDRPSPASERGTRLHELAARVLSGDPLAAYEPEDPEDAKSVLEYTDYVQARVARYERMALLGECEKPLLLVERRFHLDHLDDELWGTCDALILAAPFLEVVDYKSGGIAVPLTLPDGRIIPQLGGYGLGGIRSAQQAGRGRFKTFTLTVVQPARGGVKSMEVTRKQLAALAIDIDKALEEGRKPNAPRVPGDYCTFCKAKVACPAVRAASLGEAQAFFTDAECEEPLQEAGDIDDADLAKMIEVGERVSAWLKAARAEAWHRINEGRDVPGLKLVAKRAVRKWRDEAVTLQRLLGEGLEDADIYSRKLKSPAQIEKVDKALKTLVGELAEAVSSGAKLVPADHPSPAVPVGAAGVFTDVTDETG